MKIRYGVLSVLLAVGCGGDGAPSGAADGVPVGVDEGALADQDGKADTAGGRWVINEGGVGCGETRTGKTGPVSHFDGYTFKQTRGGQVGFEVTASQRARLLVFGPLQNDRWGNPRLTRWTEWSRGARAYRATVRWTVPEEGKYLVVLGSYVEAVTQYSLGYSCESQPHCLEYVATDDSGVSLRNFYAINVNSDQEGKDLLRQLGGHFIEEALRPGRCTEQGTVCAAVRAPVCAADITPDNGPEPQTFGSVCEFKNAVRQAAGQTSAKGHYDDGECKDLHWYWTCGTPVCREDSSDPAYLAIPVCSTQVDGNRCASEGEFCRPAQYSCGRLLRCQAIRPTVCPISQRDKKRDIQYLDEAQLADRARQLLGVKLATYQYREARVTSPRRLGFIIEDGAPAVSVDERREHVDLYGYTSLAVAALQVQQKQIDALRVEVSQLKQQLSSRRASR